jgi:hypothetical protein
VRLQGRQGRGGGGIVRVALLNGGVHGDVVVDVAQGAGRRGALVGFGVHGHAHRALRAVVVLLPVGQRGGGGLEAGEGGLGGQHAELLRVAQAAQRGRAERRRVVGAEEHQQQQAASLVAASDSITVAVSGGEAASSAQRRQ